MARNGPQFDFYEIVTIAGTSAPTDELDGVEAAVLGRSVSAEGRWYYSVHVYAKNCSWFLAEDQLHATGRFASREDFHDGSSLSVKVNPETGEGEIVDERG